MTPARGVPTPSLSLPAVEALKEGPQLVPTFGVHLVTDCPPPASFSDGLDELLDVLSDVRASVKPTGGLLEVRTEVEADNIVDGVRAGHGIVDRALITLGRVGTVTAVRATCTGWSRCGLCW